MTTMNKTRANQFSPLRFARDGAVRAFGLLASVLALGVACSGGEDTSVPVTGPSPYDDDTERLTHCEFIPAPKREPGPPPTPGALKAGIGSRYVKLPIGTPMGGYGARSTTLLGKGKSIQVDDRATRFATSFIPSAGSHDVPRADAIALEAGGERLVLLRGDSVFITEDVVFAVEDALAPDGSMRGRVIVAASHSHSAPSNWLPSYTLLPGIDKPLSQLFKRAVTAYADAARDALSKMQPARIGFALNPQSDLAQAISHDRRGQNNSMLGPDGNDAGKSKDHVAWAMRIDHSDGAPMAAVVSFPIHGIIGSEKNPLFSSDAPGAIQKSLSHAMGYPVLHVQGAAGDCSPEYVSGRSQCSSASRCLDIPNLEVVGSRAEQELRPLIESIETRDTLALEVVTRTFYVGHAGVVKRPDGRELFYTPPGDYFADGEVFDADGVLLSPIDEFNTGAGAALCGGQGLGIVPMPGVGVVGAYGSCSDVGKLAPAVAEFFDIPPDVETPFCDTVRSTSSAVRFDTGDDAPFLLVTAPGEPTAPYAAYLRGLSPAGKDHTLLLGYAQDHVGYLLTAEDWLFGGYEPSINVWGPLEGEMVLQGVIDAAKIAWTAEREDPEAGTSRASAFPFPPAAVVSPVVTNDHGTVPSSLPSTIFLPDTVEVPNQGQPAPQVSRAVGAARFIWLGGDPDVDYPDVSVEREVKPGAWELVKDGADAFASSLSGAVVLTYTPEPLKDPNPSQHYWAATWQPVPPAPYSLAAPYAPFALPLGKYRFVVKGAAQIASGAQVYAVTSAPFEVVAAPLATASAKRSVTGLTLTAQLGSAPGLRALRRKNSDSEIPLLGPWNVKVVFDDATEKTLTVEATDSGEGSLALTASELQRATNVEIRDQAGNGGVVAVTD